MSLIFTDSFSNNRSQTGRPFALVLFMLALMVFLIIAKPASATTLAGMDIDKVANEAELIFEGEVLQLQALQGNGVIQTFITFKVLDVLKGQFDAETLELTFMGGEINGQVIAVTGLTLPTAGEKGVYFVESVNENLVNPLLGWSQGHFLINTDTDGIARVTTVDNRPVTDVQPVASIPTSIKRSGGLIEGKNDTALGVVTEASPLKLKQALSLDEFKSSILKIVQDR